MYDYEKLGTFYLGKTHSLDADNAMSAGTPVLYDAKDLTTHAVIVGMTGSGKTGLGITLLEEAAIDGIPAIIIDPKGDMGNLTLNFPALQPSDFRPWVELDEATRKGMTQDEYAQQIAQRWRQGLTEWEQPAERVQRLRDAAETVIYTPGSDAGVPITVLKSLDAPPAAVLNSSDAMRERVSAATSGILTLLGIDADPLRSREHILVSTILDTAWRHGRNLDLAALIHEVQSPPFDKIGIMDLESIFPSHERLKLAMIINNVLASPGFAAWMQGDPLQIANLLYTPAGKPRLAIVSIAHLTDQERMFFVTILLNELITWMRTQPGTSSLRAILYMDEVFGYLPPTANPPSKMPMLTLLKQARAYGLGLVLATQNPVDLDYKALSNAGTWFLGRLQTERDKARVLDGLEGASATAGTAFNRREVERVLSGLQSRVFLMNNVHEDAPEVFQTRWALSYLRGPLTREQIENLMVDYKQRHAESAPPPSQRMLAAAEAPVAVAEDPRQQTAPMIAAEIPQLYAPVTDRHRGATIYYRPAVLGTAQLHYVDRKSKLDRWANVARICPVVGSLPRDPWEASEQFDEDQAQLEKEAADDARYAEIPVELIRPKQYQNWARSFKNFLYRSVPLSLYACPQLKLFSAPDQTEGDFRVAVKHETHERRDLQIEKLRKKYATKMQRLQDRIRRAEQRVDVERGQARNATLSAAVSVGSSVLAALFGRKLTSSRNVTRAASSVRSAGRVATQRSDISRAQENVRALQEDQEELERKLEDEIDTIGETLSVDEVEFTEYEVKPRKADITVDVVGLVWLPYAVDENGIADPAWQ